MIASGRLWLRNVLENKALADEDQLVAGTGAGTRFNISEKILDSLSPVTHLVSQTMEDARPVRVVSFDKSDDQNWSLGWHQDRVIAVEQRKNVERFDKWTRKSGVWHCEAPEEILSRMLFVRVHLDRTDATNGAMEIVPNSHLKGFLSDQECVAYGDSAVSEVCCAGRGDILILDMLTLHRSPPSKSNIPRRAIRIDYANFDLPSPLKWASEV